MQPSDAERDLLRKLVGLGERSLRKTYYTELRKGMRELERFRVLLDRVGDGIILASLPDGTLLDANSTAMALFGLSPSDMGARRLPGIIRDISLDPATAREIRVKIREYAAGGAGGILWTSHNMVEVEEVCERVAMAADIHGTGKLKPVCLELNGEVSYEHIRVVFALLEDSLALDWAGPAEALRIANQLLVARGQAPRFQLEFAAGRPALRSSVGVTLVWPLLSNSCSARIWPSRPTFSCR